jgi:large subunit ribosomal protein L6
MSRNGILLLPKNIKVDLEEDNTLVVTGKLGSISKKINQTVSVSLNKTSIFVVPSDKSRNAKMQTGTARSIINGMLVGVSVGFEKKLQLVGVGYRVSVKENILILNLGFSHPIYCKIPSDIKLELISSSEIILKSVNKELLGQFASDVRNYRKPEPYKGKGIRYADEKVIVKEAKKK